MGAKRKDTDRGMWTKGGEEREQLPLEHADKLLVDCYFVL